MKLDNTTISSFFSASNVFVPTSPHILKESFLPKGGRDLYQVCQDKNGTRHWRCNRAGQNMTIEGACSKRVTPIVAPCRNLRKGVNYDDFKPCYGIFYPASTKCFEYNPLNSSHGRHHHHHHRHSPSPSPSPR